MPDVRLIDANALMKRIEEVYCKDCNSHNGVMCRACAHMDDMDFIEDAPTIDAQPVKRGKWRKRMSTSDSVKCCLCGYASIQESSYCGGCGAFMRGDADANS
jgi:hypothetical protein